MSERRLRLDLKPSPLLASTLVALHAAAGGCVVLVLPGWQGALLATALTALGAASAWSRALHASRASVRSIELHGSSIRIRLASGETVAAELAERRYVSRFMVSLRIVRPMRRNLLVTRDMLQGDLFRRLCIWALWGKLPAVAAKQLPA